MRTICCGSAGIRTLQIVSTEPMEKLTLKYEKMLAIWEETAIISVENKKGKPGETRRRKAKVSNGFQIRRLTGCNRFPAGDKVAVVFCW